MNQFSGRIIRFGHLPLSVLLFNILLNCLKNAKSVVYGAKSRFFSTNRILIRRGSADFVICNL